MKLSKPQREVLTRMAAGKPARVFQARTNNALYRRGLLKWSNEKGDYILTDAGREAAATVEVPE